tara:strand:- start:806 stop:2203 length:1398 start_codon:yes stop_codon:yes gene_type:complete
MEDNSLRDENEISRDVIKGFTKLLYEFTRDLLNTFPELEETLDDSLRVIHDNYLAGDGDGGDGGGDDGDGDGGGDGGDESPPTCSVKLYKAGETVFNYCNEVFPERFFDILYKNENMFSDDSCNTEFFPGIKFSVLWKEDISDKTKEVLWRYLQITLFTIVNNVNSDANFGDTANLFEAINEDDLQEKIKETFENITSMFSGNHDASGNVFEDLEKMTRDLMEGMDGGDLDEDADNDEDNVGQDTKQPGTNNKSGASGMNLPSPEELNEHLGNLMKGKLGRLAQEIAEETVSDIETTDDANVTDVFEKMIKNPGKLMDLIKKIGGKIDEKIKRGDISETEIMQEATELMNQMKDMPGMKNMEEMMSEMASKLGGKNAKFNMNAFNQKTKQAGNRDRMMRELEKRRAEKLQAEMEGKASSVPLAGAGGGAGGGSEEKLVFKKASISNAEPNEKTPIRKKKKNKKKK